MNHYTDWIQSRVKGEADLAGQCGDIAEEMAAHFPELRVVGGFVRVTKEDVDKVYTPRHDLYDARLMHHTWCVAPDGMIVDPTATQFRKITEYLEA